MFREGGEEGEWAQQGRGLADWLVGGSCVVIIVCRADSDGLIDRLCCSTTASFPPASNPLTSH